MPKFTDTQFSIAAYKWFHRQGTFIACVMAIAALVMAGVQSARMSAVTEQVVTSAILQSNTGDMQVYYKERFDELLDRVDAHMQSTQASFENYVVHQVALQRDQLVRMREQLVDVLVQNTDLITALEDGGYGVVRADKNRRITYWNSVMAGKFGYSRDEALRMRIEELMVEETREAHNKYYEAAMQQGHSEAKLRTCGTALHKDGKTIDVHFLLIVPRGYGDTIAIFPPFNVDGWSVLDLNRQQQKIQQTRPVLGTSEIQPEWRTSTPNYQQTQQQ